MVCKPALRAMSLCDLAPRFQVRHKTGVKKIKELCVQLFDRLQILIDAWVWTKAEHKHFPVSFKRAIWTMLLCRKRIDVFSRVPKDVLVYEIIPNIAKVWTKPCITINQS